jgi:hypothetical protein
MNAEQRQQCIDIIDFVETKLLEQGSRSVQSVFGISANQCALRGANGMKCAIGY